MAHDAFREIKCATADEMWDSLSPTNELFPCPNELIFRGQGSADWKLIPSVLRAGSDNSLTRSWGETSSGRGAGLSGDLCAQVVCRVLRQDWNTHTW